MKAPNSLRYEETEQGSNAEKRVGVGRVYQEGMIAAEERRLLGIIELVMLSVLLSVLVTALCFDTFTDSYDSFFSFDTSKQHILSLILPVVAKAHGPDVTALGNLPAGE